MINLLLLYIYTVKIFLDLGSRILIIFVRKQVVHIKWLWAPNVIVYHNL